MSSELRLKKLRGSGGYVMATVTDEQQMKGNLGGPDLFLAPIGRLDGGRASMAAWGRRSASLISLASLLLLAFFSFNGLSGIIAFWGAMLVLTRQRQEDIPALNEVSDIGFFRIASYNALLILSLLTIAPFPGNVSTF